jgi:hypothetical protein
MHGPCELGVDPSHLASGYCILMSLAAPAGTDP